MCRVVGYLGSPLPLDTLLFRADSALVKQVYDPKLMVSMNLAGFGVVAWDDASRHPEQPFLYRETRLPMYDLNLEALAQKVHARCAIAHIRGAPYADRPGLNSRIGHDSCHPFMYPGLRVALAHNGQLARFDEMRFDLADHVDDRYKRILRGTTDSEWIYALLLTQLEDPTRPQSPEELTAAVLRTYDLLRSLRDARGIDTTSAVNLFITDGDNLVATRFAFDYGCYEHVPSTMSLWFNELWYTAGTGYGQLHGRWRMQDGAVADSILFASEPLTEDTTGWIQLQEYSMLAAWTESGRVCISVTDLDA